jgi:hypothetical protein
MKQRNRIVRFFLYTIMSAVLLSSPAISAEQDNSSIAKGKELAPDCNEITLPRQRNDESKNMGCHSVQPTKCYASFWQKPHSI